MWMGRWCIRNWELFLLRIFPLLGVVFALLGIAQNRLVSFNAVAVIACAVFFLSLRLIPAVHCEAKANLTAMGQVVAGASRLFRRLLG